MSAAVRDTVLGTERDAGRGKKARGDHVCCKVKRQPLTAGQRYTSLSRLSQPLCVRVFPRVGNPAAALTEGATRRHAHQCLLACLPYPVCLFCAHLACSILSLSLSLSWLSPLLDILPPPRQKRLRICLDVRVSAVQGVICTVAELVTLFL